jgi:hypothetical protein
LQPERGLAYAQGTRFAASIKVQYGRKLWKLGLLTIAEVISFGWRSRDEELSLVYSSRKRDVGTRHVHFPFADS